MEEVKRMGLNNVLNLSFGVVVTPEDIDDIMVSALEGGITYWANRAKVPEEKEWQSGGMNRLREMENFTSM